MNEIPKTPTRILKRIGAYHFHLDDLIGQGYSAHVYKGYHSQTRELVAIKVINQGKLTTDISKTLLKNELVALKKINSPYLLKVLDIYTSLNNTYIITEFCNQGDLTKMIKTLDEQRSLTIITQLLKGLKELKNQNIIHRDIKPANILIANDVFKLADFGFAIDSEYQESIITRFKVGTPVFMAPETVFANKYTDKSDVWALGITFYLMVHKCYPFEYETLQDENSIILKQSPLDITNSLIQAMIQVNPEKRSDVDQLLEMITKSKIPRKIRMCSPTHFSEGTYRKLNIQPPMTPSHKGTLRLVQSSNNSGLSPVQPNSAGNSESTKPSDICRTEPFLHEDRTSIDQFLSVKIRPSVHFCQYLDVVLKKINEYQYNIRKLQALKAKQLIKECPNEIHSLLYTWIARFDDYARSHNLSNNIESEQVFYTEFINQVETNSKNLITIKDILQENIKQQYSMILFARKWDNDSS